MISKNYWCLRIKSHVIETYFWNSNVSKFHCQVRIILYFFVQIVLLLAAKTLGRRSLIVPLEVRVRDVCCVGLSTQDTLQVQNPSENWVKVTFEVTRVTVDGKPMNECFTCPFSLKNKTLIEPKNSEEIKVEIKFKPLYSSLIRHHYNC